ncbi:MAG: hypothetical protein NTW19_04345 [Planctomycetota bacterium]|nr:hypothetical protein [Planctomycetota bacterium]
MDILDYGQSFLMGKWTENRVRFWVESRTRIIDERTGRTEDYIQCASCKSEDTFATKDLFYADNYDFLPIFGPELGVIFRRKAYIHPRYRDVQPVSEMWGGQDYRLRVVPEGKGPGAARLLKTTAEIRRATHEGWPLVGQTEYADAATGLRAILEHPIKTMNIHDERDLYQVDTGPLAFADLSTRPERLVDTLSLAFVAYNAPDWTDVVIEAATPIVEDGAERTKIHHYSKRQTFKAQNRVYALGGPN